MASLAKQEEFARAQRILNLVDDLRDVLQGEEGIELPSIAVIGNQSAGKSSLLERLSGVPLPRGEGMKTKCPLLMRLRRGSEREFRLGINPESLEKVTLEEIEAKVDKLTETLTGSTTADDQATFGGLVDAPLHLKVTGPDLPNLTLIDLPGIFFVDKEGRDIPETVKFIENMYSKYISSPACVIVVVMPATEDSATQRARGIAKAHDPQGERTISVLTKVDRCGDSMDDVVRRLQGEGSNSLRSKLGAVALRNPKDGHLSANDRTKVDEKETTFFKNTAALSKLDPAFWGLGTLEAKMGQVQLDRYSKAIPLLRKQIGEKLSRTSAERRQLPEVPSTAADAQRMFSDQIHSFMARFKEITELRYQSLSLLTAASEPADDSNNTAPSRSDQLSSAQSAERQLHILPRLAELFDGFEGDVQRAGRHVLHKDFHQYVDQKHREVRGRSVEGMHAGIIFDDLVREEVALLEAPATKLLRAVHELMRKTVASLVRLHFTSSERLASAINNVFEAMLLQTKDDCEGRISELIEQESLPFTLNHYYYDTLSQMKASNFHHAWIRERARTDADKLAVVDGVMQSDDDWVQAITKHDRTDGDGEPTVGSNAEEAIIELQLKLYAYRKVLQKRFVDQIAALMRLKFPLRLAVNGTKVLGDSIRLKAEAPVRDSAGATPLAPLPMQRSSAGPRPRYDLEELMLPSASLAAKQKQLKISEERLQAALDLLDESL